MQLLLLLSVIEIPPKFHTRHYCVLEKTLIQFWFRQFQFEEGPTLTKRDLRTDNVKFLLYAF